MGQYEIENITSKKGIAYNVVYVPLNEEVKDLNGLLFKRYFNENNLVKICGVGIRLEPSIKRVPDVPFPTIQRGVVVMSDESDAFYAFGDAWEGVTIKNVVNRSGLKYITITANQLLEEHIKANA